MRDTIWIDRGTYREQEGGAVTSPARGDQGFDYVAHNVDDETMVGTAAGGTEMVRNGGMISSVTRSGILDEALAKSGAVIPTPPDAAPLELRKIPWLLLAAVALGIYVVSEEG